MSTKIEKANNYISENRHKVIGEYRPSFHAVAPIGWVNDPNGFTMFKEEYHLFYQFNPYDSKWDQIHWGHSKSKDLITWEELPVALAPDMPYDNRGCFSGGALEDGDSLVLMYTGNYVNQEGQEGQVQCLATSKDGIHFSKDINNPIISASMLPNDCVVNDFRDPNIWKQNGMYHCVVASRNKDTSGQILLYTSEDLVNWTYKNIVSQSKNLIGGMWECPDLFRIDEYDILLLSAMNVEKVKNNYWNVQSCLYMTGGFDYKTGIFDNQFYDEIDYGLDFYAPQTLIDSKGRRIMIAWMQMWFRTYVTHELGHQWAGCMTLPRELSIKNGKLIQMVVEEIKDYRRNEITYNNILMKGNKTFDGIFGNTLELELEVDLKQANQFGVKLYKGNGEETLLYYIKDKQYVIFDRFRSGHYIESPYEIHSGIRIVPVNVTNNILKWRIFLDRCTVEVFINDGERAISSTVFPTNKEYGIEFFSDKDVEIKTISKWELVLIHN